MSKENHNHITRDIKPPGQCYSCDRYHAISLNHLTITLKNEIWSTLQEADQRGAAAGIDYLTYTASARGIRGFEDLPL